MTHLTVAQLWLVACQHVLLAREVPANVRVWTTKPLFTRQAMMSNTQPSMSMSMRVVFK